MRMTACTYEICPTVPSCADSSISANPEAWLFLQMGASQPLAVFAQACIFCACLSEFRGERWSTMKTSGLSSCHELRRFLGHTENPPISAAVTGIGNSSVFRHADQVGSSARLSRSAMIALPESADVSLVTDLSNNPT